MNKLLNAVKEKFNYLKQNVVLRTVLICTFALLLIFSVTLAWYINNLGLWGMEFNTGHIEFNAYVYGEDGTRLLGPVASNDENESKYINAPLVTIQNAQVGSTGTAYIAIESTGSINIQYRFAFDITGRTESATAYLGGYKYNISKVTDKVVFSPNADLDVTRCPRPEKINDEVVTIDRNAVNGTIDEKVGYDIYRFDYTLVNKNEEYTDNGINIYFNIFATQVGGSFDDSEERGYTYYCSTREDIDRARVEAYPGDIIKLSSDIVYYGDLVFNKPINLETNDFTLTVNGNLMYDYVLGNGLKIDAGGLGRVVVQCTKEGVGGNLQIKAPISNVTLTGSNAVNGDIVVEKNITVDATNTFGSPGVSFNNVRIVDNKNSRKAIQLESNTRATVSFGTTIGLLQSVVKANNIEIVNNGVIGDINLSNMELLEQTNSPQIYILNNNDITSPISLPSWSVKFVEDASGTCTGNTRIIQSHSGSPMSISGTCEFSNDDIEVEKRNELVEQIEENNDSRLKIYYQDLDGQTTTIQSILENYFQNDATTDCLLNEVLQLEIISIGDKAITAADIAFMNGNSMLSLKHLDLQRANVYDRSTDTANRLPNGIFSGVNKYETLILPQNLEQIGDHALSNTNITNIITVPAGVTVFGTNWFRDSEYVSFAASVPVLDATNGLNNVRAIFVEEAYITSYKNVYTVYNTRIFPNSVLDESKQHFVRNIKNDEWEITYYIRAEDGAIGENITMDGKILKITSIYDHAYRHNFTASQVKFVDTIENIGAGNFYGNKNITFVDLGNIKTIGVNAFYNCPSLSKVVFGDKLESIGANAFLNCVSLNHDVVLPATMKTIGASAFRQTKITMVNTGGTKTIEGQAFYSCKSLIYAELPEVEIVAETGVNELFALNDSLVSVKMPSLVKAGGNRMFASCQSLREVYMDVRDDSISLGGSPFAECNLQKLKLYVSEQNVAFYKSKLSVVIASAMVFPMGEKMGEELVNGFNIGTYIVFDNGDDTYTLSTSNINYVDKCIIPETYNGKAITKIYENAFRNQGFTDVTLYLGNNLRSIGRSAFYARNGISEIVFGNALQVLDTYAFSYCSNLVQDIVLPASMRTIGSDAFSYSGILSINTGGTTSVESYAFRYCASLIYAKLPEVTVIAESGTNEVFARCTSLVSVDMPKVTMVSGKQMFSYCTSLTEVYMGAKDANVSLGDGPFTNTNTANIKLFVPEDAVTLYRGRNILNAAQVYPKGIKIGNKSINGYLVGDYILIENETGYTLVTSNLAFAGNVILPSEYNNKPITEIYMNAFRNQSFTDVNIVLGDQVKVIGTCAFYGRTGLKSIIMDQVTTVDVSAFQGCGIRVLNAPKLTTIGNDAFRKITSLEIVNMPQIENIEGTYAFAECTNLKIVYFENVMTLNQWTFYGCKKLEKITINKLINSDGSNKPSIMSIDAAAPCKIYVPYHSLSSYSNPWSNKPVVSFDTTASYNGDTYILSQSNDGRYALIDFLPAKSVTSLILPATVKSDSGSQISIYAIEYGAFTTVAGTLKNITLSSSVAYLENGALSECNELENIYVNSSNRFFTAVNGILYSKDKKMLVKYPAGREGRLDLTTSSYASTVVIGAGAFTNANGLTEIVFPASLAVIDGTAFENCGKLKTVAFTGNTPPTLLGANIFDTSIEGFKMTVPTSTDVLASYLNAYNFDEYEPYINRA